MVFNLADFCNSPNCQNKFYTKFSSYMVLCSVKSSTLNCYKETFVTKFFVIFGNSWKSQNIFNYRNLELYMYIVYCIAGNIGFLVGGPVWGMAADKFGRKRVS